MKKAIIIIAALVVAFLGFGAIVGNTPEGRAMQADRDKIDTCWDTQKRKSLDPYQQRIMAGACENMEGDFRQRFGRNP